MGIALDAGADDLKRSPATRSTSPAIRRVFKQVQGSTREERT